MQEPVVITHGMLASGAKRFLNYIIDRVVIALLQLALAEAFNRLYDIYGHEGLLVGPPMLGNVKFAMLGIGLSIAYYGLFETISMRTPGKYATNTMVISRDGTQPDSGRIFIRTLCRLIPFEEISFLMRPVIGLHDGLSKTLVVDIKQFKNGRKVKDVKDSKNDNEENNDYEQR